MVLETEWAALAAERVTDEGLHALETLLARMQTAKDGNGHQSTYSELDVEFHLAIAATSKNKILS